MNPDGTIGIDDATKAVEAATGAIGAIQKLFPGMAQSSLDRAESKSTKRLLKDVKIIKRRGADIGLSEETIREFADDAFRRHGRREHFEKVVSFAAEEITHPENVDRVDPEWADEFRIYAETSHDEEMQRLWAAVLAGEINKPGSFSKRTMSALKGMSKNEAQAFRAICSYSTQINVVDEMKDSLHEPIIVLVKDESDPTFNCGSLKYDDLSILDAIGLIDTSLMLHVVFQRGESHPYIAHDEVVIVQYNGENDSIQVDFEHAIFRPSGIELSKICGIGFAENLGDILSKKFADSGFSITRVALQHM